MSGEVGGIATVTSEEELPPNATTGGDTSNNGGNNNSSNYNNNGKSLVIPITTSTNGNNYNTDNNNKDGSYIEIFPEEMSSIRPTTLTKVLRDEQAPLTAWCDASLLYMKAKREKEGCELINAAADSEDVMSGSNNQDRLRVLSSAGIAALAQANKQTEQGIGAAGVAGGVGGAGALALDDNDDDDVGGADAISKSNEVNEKEVEDLRAMADARFTKADNINQINPMTWIGRGMLNLANNKFDQARFYFENLTFGKYGEILPALIGMAAVKYLEKDFTGAQELYGRAMTKFPVQSGAAARVGFGMASYKLGQIDRAKAAFRRAHEIDPENVDALVGIAVLEMASLDEVLDAREHRAKAENVMKMISMANLVDHTNAMVQNHLANHYFWKWTPVPGMATAERGSNVIKGSMASSLEPGDRIRIGREFETLVDESDDMDDGNSFKIKDSWKFESADGQKIWKKDYDRVVSLAKGAYNSTNIPEVRAESLYMLARVYHARGDMAQANKYYEKACKHAPELSPARFGLAQTLIWDEVYEEAAAHLRLLLGTCSNATDALAALGLLEVRSGKDRREAFVYLKKAIDLDPFNADLVLIEALALQQHESDYPQALDRYRKAVSLLESQSKPVPVDVLTNMGVLCHETKQYDAALEMYAKALNAVDADAGNADSIDDQKEVPLKHKDNSLFWDYSKTDVVVKVSDDDERKLIVSSEADVESFEIKSGDDISLEGGVETTVASITKADDGSIHITVTDDVEKTGESSLSVKRSNRKLQNLSSISIAFNFARAHESAGRVIPAVELHKAIVKLHPSYVNSYLRLACIARDCGSLKECAEWLKSAVAVAPGNPEVLTLVGNLHLSLCDWAPAQKVFDQLLTQKNQQVEAYSMLSMGNIYFNNLNTAGKYNKHLQYAADFYRRILQKDNANAYAANGLGTVLAEKGKLLEAKEVFNRVREVSGDTIADALLNLGHIYLAQKKHPEALQMYLSYMTRTQSSGAQITSKSQEDDEAEVLQYIAFAHFDWARQTELFNDAKAAPADERYKKCIEYLEMAMKKSKRENILLRFNWCMAKLQAANCVLQKVNRNIRRTAQEVKDALNGLEECLPVIQTMIQWKQDKRKVPIQSSMLTDFVSQCKHNIDSAKGHLAEELRKETDAKALRDIQQLNAEATKKSNEMKANMDKEREAQEEQDREKRAKAKMAHVGSLTEGWKTAEIAKKEKAAAKKKKGDAPPGGVDDEGGIFDTDVAAADTSALFDDSDEEDDDDEDGNDDAKKTTTEAVSAQGEQATQKDLFGDSSDEEEEENPKKRSFDEVNDSEQAAKRTKVDEEEEQD
jgi:RNA polymerase-associated protein CTR9